MAIGVGAIYVVAAYGTYVGLFTIGVCWLWPDYVDNTEARRVRRILIRLAMLLSLEEWVLYMADVISVWSFLALLFCNLWGHLDAFLRFPIVHDLDSLFALKQLFLLLLKVASYLLGYKKLAQNLAWAVLALLINVCTLPIIWLTALPIGDINSYHQKHDVVDQDLAWRIWRFARVSSDRALCVAHFKASCRRALATLAEQCPPLKPLVLRLDPQMQRVLRKARAQV